MENETKSVLKRYLVCLCVGIGLVVAIFAIKGFFTDNAKGNIQLLHDAFFGAGALLMLFAGLHVPHIVSKEYFGFYACES